MTGTEEMLRRALFGPAAVAEGLVAERHGEPVGFAIFYTTFSTWQCRAGLWLEDLFVVPEERRAGIGRRLLTHLAAIAAERDCGRLEWSALNWNTPAIDFYLGLGAERMVEWNNFRLEGDALTRVAREADARSRRTGPDVEKPRRSGASR